MHNFWISKHGNAQCWVNVPSRYAVLNKIQNAMQRWPSNDWITP